MAAYTYDAGVVIDYATGDPVGGGVTLEFRATPTGSAVQVYDLNNSPITLVTSDMSSFPPFSAAINRGFLVAGAVTPQEVLSDQLQDAGPAAAAAAAAASAAAAAASQSAIDAAAARVAAENAAVGSLTAQERATLAALAGVDTAGAAAGWVITWDDDNAQFVLSSVTVSADDITTGTLGIGRLPLGVPVIVSKSEDNYGATDTWPITRPGDADHPVIWEGDREGTDGPGVIMLGGPDFRWFTE